MTAASYYELSLDWNSHQAQHRDRLVIAQLEQQDDPLSENLQQQLSTLSPGQSEVITLPPEYEIPCYSEDKLYNFESRHFNHTQPDTRIKPVVGRFYPQGFIADVLNGKRNDFTPFRLIQIDDDMMTADLNHPLSRFSIQVTGHCLPHPVTSCQVKQAAPRLLNDLLNSGSGLQVSNPDIATDFYSAYPFKRENDSADSDFYQRPRMVKHLDNCAIEQVKQIYQRLLKPGDKILDLMSSVYSHIPENLQRYQATGLGMNATELAANPQLNSYLLHDLNKNPQLPFARNSFDAVICTSSIEYLTRPIEVLQQLAAVCKSGALVIVTFSTRFFPGKQIHPWSEMHPFERQGMVLDFFIKSGCYGELHSESIRGYARPATDKHYPQSKSSDPVFAVWGKVE